MFDKEVYIPWKEHFDRTFVPEIKVLSANPLRPRYAMSGTDRAREAIGLCACYAMSGTDLAYVRTRKRQGR
eukprot:3749581-Rhodomonas_salina.2